MLRLLEGIDNTRKEIGRLTSREHKSEFGQFMTPLTVARFMASLFSPSKNPQRAKLLDAGAGIGSLSGAFLDRWASGELRFRHVEVIAYEIDVKLGNHLSKTLAGYKDELNIDSCVKQCDFIEEAVKLIWEGKHRFTHAILNPPYKKINSSSRHRLLLRKVGIETVNMYSAFIALAIELMAPGGQVVAITPRSFCNGPYYRPFRDFILSKTAIKHIHLFGSRDKAFKDDNVLQENIIFVLESSAMQGDVTISTSTDDSFSDIHMNHYPFDDIIRPGEPDRFIHVPTSLSNSQSDLASAFVFSLADIGLDVSTGPVVDFRAKAHLREMPEPGSVPLLYPGHFLGQEVNWPKIGAKKPNAILRNEETEKWLYPTGHYVVVRRFSSKEERHRVMASVVCPDDFNESMLGFENHLNVYHSSRRGIPEEIARGLSVFLNSSAVDDHFRRFSGHTQVNATDLRLIKYPSYSELIRLGVWAKSQSHLTQEKIDKKIESLACLKTKK